MCTQSVSINGDSFQEIIPGRIVVEGKSPSDEIGFRRVFNLFQGLSIGLILLRVSPFYLFLQFGVAEKNNIPFILIISFCFLCPLKKKVQSNFSVSGNRYVGGIAGYSSANVGTEIRNCIVENGSLIATPDNLTGKYDNGDKVGGIIGYCVVGDIVEGCIVSNVSLKEYRDVGGVIGYRNTSEDVDNPIIKNNKVSDIDITIDGEHNYNNYDSEEDFDAGAIIGDTYGGNVDGSNSSSNCTIKYINTDF